LNNENIKKKSKTKILSNFNCDSKTFSSMIEPKH
jgi:hypothetical protein